MKKFLSLLIAFLFFASINTVFAKEEGASKTPETEIEKIHKEYKEKLEKAHKKQLKKELKKTEKANKKAEKQAKKDEKIKQKEANKKAKLEKKENKRQAKIDKKQEKLKAKEDKKLAKENAKKEKLQAKKDKKNKPAEILSKMEEDTKEQTPVVEEKKAEESKFEEKKTEPVEKNIKEASDIKKEEVKKEEVKEEENNEEAKESEKTVITDPSLYRQNLTFDDIQKNDVSINEFLNFTKKQNEKFNIYYYKTNSQLSTYTKQIKALEKEMKKTKEKGLEIKANYEKYRKLDRTRDFIMKERDSFYNKSLQKFNSLLTKKQQMKWEILQQMGYRFLPTYD